MEGTPAEVIQIFKKSGPKGITQVRCKIIEGNDTGKILSRNVVGPVKKGDVLLLSETEMESAGSFNRRR